MERINIVGAGIIGLACAWRLAQRGNAVTIFDAREAAKEASWTGAGMLAPGGEYHEPSELALRAIHSLSLYPDFVRELEEESQISIDFRRSGAVEVAYSEAEAVALDIKAAAQAGFGIPSEGCVFQGRSGRLYPKDALVDPRDVTQALVIACRQRGVTIMENQTVGVMTKETAPTLITAGAWSSMPSHRVTPVRGHLISYDSPPGLLEPILRHGATYLLQRRSGLLVAGATTERVGFDRTIDPTAVADLAQRAGELLPVLAGRSPENSWNGFRPHIEGEVPFVGQIEPNLWGAFGHYRNGILLAPETAERVVGMMLSRKPISGTDSPPLHGSQA